MALLGLFLLTTACETRAANVRVSEVIGPMGGDALTIVSMGSEVVVPTEFGMFVSTHQQWLAQPGLGLSSPDPTSPMNALVRDGAQMNYPRSSLVARFRNQLWMVSRIDGAVSLLWSDSLGERWKPVKVPPLSDATDEDNESGPAPAIQAAEPPRLVTGFHRMFLVGTTNVWEFDGTEDEPTWTSIGLNGLPVASEGLPPAIRNYLPRTRDRPFEMLTVLADQLLVFRRSEVDDPWILTSTMAVVDRELVGMTGSDAVFVVAPNSIQRTDDQGESWFRFWPEGHPRIEAFTLLPGSAERAFDMIVGSADGSIWRSADAGATWNRTRPSDQDGRAITGLAAHANALWAASLGEGVLFSVDRGQTWTPRNLGLRAARPLDIAFTGAGDILLASRAGLVQLSGEPDSGNWAVIDDRATSAVSVDPISDRMVSGTIRGDLATRAEEGEAIETALPFGTKHVFEFSPHQLPRTSLPPSAVVSINARDDGRRWLAWSGDRGGVQSEDGGEQWTPLELSDGLRAALAATTVRQVLAEQSETIYLLEENRDPRAPGLLWRSDDDGESWTTVHAFPRDRTAHVLLRARPPNYPGTLFAAHGDQFLRSADSGSTWTQIEGPWRGNRIVGLAIREQRAAVLLDSRRRLEVVVLEGLDRVDPVISRHTIVPDDDAVIDPEDIARFELYDRRILIAGKQRIWTGTLPEARRALGDGLAFLATLAGALLLIAAAFAIMRSSPAK